MKSVHALSNGSTSDDLANGLVRVPLRFETHLEPRVWGGERLGGFGKTLPPGEPIGEAWDLSDVEGKPSVVRGGPHAGRTLRELVASCPRDLLGTSGVDADGRFPLLMKLLDAQRNLSVQIHPSDDDLRAQGSTRSGKTEAWIVLEAEPGARVLYGRPDGTSSSDFYDAMTALGGAELAPDDEARFLAWVPVTPGDVIYVPAGTIHALGEGVVLLEVQQTSDTTYRIYDWGRLGLDGRPRDLHLPEARAVSEPPPVPCPLTTVDRASKHAVVAPLVECDKFVAEVISVTAGDPLELSTRGTTGERFHIVSGFEGAVSLLGGSDRKGAIELSRGDLVLLPACLGDYQLLAASDARCLRFWAPS